TFTVNTGGGTCPFASSLTGVLTIGVGLDSTSGASSQEVCKDENIVPIIYNVVGDSVNINFAPNQPADITTVYNASTKQLTISGKSDVEGAFTFTVNTTGGTCPFPSLLTG